MGILRPLLGSLGLFPLVLASAEEWTPTADKFDFHPRFKTEPYIELTRFQVTQKTSNESELSPGYLFFTLQTFKDGGRAWGPQIFDLDGTLIYYSIGNQSMAPQAPHVCDYLGENGTHICASDVSAMVQGRWVTTKAIVKNDYTLEQEPYGAVGEFSGPDGHEFAMIDNGRSYLQPVYEEKTADLRVYGAPEDGKILDACFQEVSVESGEDMFNWCYMDNFDISQTYIYLNVTGNTVNITSHLAGTGDADHPWDAFHINALDKNFEGDYLVSIRHTNQVLKVAGKRNLKGFEAGHVLWQLGGKTSDFELMDGLMFSRQHHARYVESTEAYTTISIFDNGWEGDNEPSSTYSAGKIIKLDHASKEARLVQEYTNPDVKQSMAGGNLQTLPNGNQLIGWGWQPHITEFAADGRILYDVEMASVDGVFSYRSRKYPWVGKPKWSPKLVAYSQTCNSKVSPLIAYVSWNGATEVKSWKFQVSLTSKLGPWLPAGTHKKTGFETEVVLNEGSILSRLPLIRYVSVQALDAAGYAIGETVTSTYIPSEDIRGEICGERGCTKPYYDYTKGSDILTDTCVAPKVVYIVPGIIALIIVFIAIEGVQAFYDRIFRHPIPSERAIKYTELKDGHV